MIVVGLSDTSFDLSITGEKTEFTGRTLYSLSCYLGGCFITKNNLSNMLFKSYIVTLLSRMYLKVEITRKTFTQQ